MLRATSLRRYAVKIEKSLPHRQDIAPVLARSFATVAHQCDELVATDWTRDRGQLAPWQQVMAMQATSYYNVLHQLLEGTDISNVERLFEKGPVVDFAVGRDKGCGRRLRRGEHLPSSATIARNTQRLESLHPGEELPLGADCFQLLWRALLLERPIADAAHRCVEVHSWYDMEIMLHALRSIHSPGEEEHVGLWIRFDFGTLPRLAGFIVLLRHCAEIGKHAEARLVAPRVCQLLALLGPELHARGIARPLFQYCTEHILPLGGLRVTPARIACASSLLNLAAMSTRDHIESEAVPWLNRSAVMASVLRGEFGNELQLVCDPTVPVPSTASWLTIRTSELRWLMPRECMRWQRPHDETISLPQLLARTDDADQWVVPPSHAAAAKTPRSWCDGLCDSNGQSTGLGLAN